MHYNNYMYGNTGVNGSYSGLRPMRPNGINSSNNRFGGFFGPFVLGGITGGLVAPFFTGGYNRPNYYPGCYYPPYYGPYRPY